MKNFTVCAARILSILMFATICFAQQDSSAEVYAESWSTEHLREYQFSFELEAAQNEYSQMIRRGSGNGYKLRLQKISAGKEDYQLEYWVVTLHEILSKENSKKENLGCNLLLVEGCGGGGDNFPREGLIGILFPRENPTRLDLLIHGNYYPLYAKRTIKVKSFYVIIKVNSYKMNETEPKRIDSMNVSVEFKNKLQ